AIDEPVRVEYTSLLRVARDFARARQVARFLTGIAMSKRPGAAIGIDVGGTFIKAGVVGSDGCVQAHESVPTEADSGPDAMIARMAELARTLKSASKTGIKAVGLGMPGTLSHSEGIIYSPPNLPGWRNVPVAELLSKVVGLPVVLENDAN